MPVSWSDEIDDVLAGDLVTAFAYRTPAGGAVVTAVAPIGLRDRAAGTVGLTTSLGFGRKLERVQADPRVAVAYHAREHGFSTSPRYVLVQGRASFDPSPDPEQMEEIGRQSVPFMGEPRRGRGWDWLLREYYADRVVVTIDVERVVAWPDLLLTGEPEVLGAPLPDAPEPQRPPKNGTGPRVDLDRAARRVSQQPHRLLGFAGGDGYPVVVPVALGARTAAGVQLIAPPGVLPPGGRRAGLLGHGYRAKLIGLTARQHTGWFEVSDDGTAVYAPHTETGFQAPPNKVGLLVGNGLMAKYGLWQARRQGRVEALSGTPRSSDQAARSVPLKS